MDAISDVVVARQRAFRVLDQMLKTHGPELTRKLGTLLTGQAPIGADAAQVVTLLGQILNSHLDTLLGSDQAHHAELADEAPLQEARDLTVAQIYKVLLALKRAVVLMFGETGARQMHLAGELPTTPDDMLLLCGQVLEFLTAGKTPLSEAETPPGVSLDLTQFIEPLKTGARALEQALTGLAAESAEARATLMAKNEALRAYDQAHRGVANMLYGLCVLLGEDELAGTLSTQPFITYTRKAADSTPPSEGSPATP